VKRPPTEAAVSNDDEDVDRCAKRDEEPRYRNSEQTVIASHGSCRAWKSHWCGFGWRAPEFGPASENESGAAGRAGAGRGRHFSKKNPPLTTGPSLGRKRPRQSKSIRGSVMCRNSHTERETHSGRWDTKRPALLPPYTTGSVRIRSNLDIKLGPVIGGWQWRAVDRRCASRCGHSSRSASGLGVAFVGATLSAHR
jgi:hypothetical protein